MSLSLDLRESSYIETLVQKIQERNKLINSIEERIEKVSRFLNCSVRYFNLEQSLKNRSSTFIIDVAKREQEKLKKDKDSANSLLEFAVKIQKSVKDFFSNASAFFKVLGGVVYGKNNR